MEIDAQQRDRQEVSQNFLDRARLGSRVQLVKGASVPTRSVIEGELSDGIDILYIDGDHSIEGVFDDFRTYYEDVRVGGYILLHDIYPAMCACDGPRVLLDKLAESSISRDQLQVTEYPTSDGYGVAVIRKISGAPIPPTWLAGSAVKRASNRVSSWIRQSGKTPSSLMVAVPVDIRVVDAETGEPIGDAAVSCPQLPVDGECRTDSQGVATLGSGNLLPNRYLVDVSAEGCAAQTNVMLDVTWRPQQQTFSIRLSRQRP